MVDARTLAHEAASSRGDRRQFVLFQVLVWLLLATVMVLPGFSLPVRSWAQVALWVSLWAVLGVAISSGLAAVLVHVPDRLLRGMAVVGVMLAASVLASALWGSLLLAAEPLIGREPWAPPDVPQRRYLMVNFTRGVFFLGLWSALFLVNLLASRVQREREHSVRAQALADQAHLQLLRSQINPHFLFNALNSVVALIAEDPRAAKTMVRDVASLLRRALDADGGRDTTVAQELEFVRLYVKCEEVRFESRLQVSFEVGEDVLALPVPPMLLHPLVENAIKHGLRGAVSGPLVVRVSVGRVDDELVFEVANSGTLEASTDALLPPPSGIGLKNVRARLATLFPQRHSFSLVERDGQVLARLTLPVTRGTS